MAGCSYGVTPPALAGQHSVDPHHEQLPNCLNLWWSLVYERHMTMAALTRQSWRGLAVSLVRRIQH